MLCPFAETAFRPGGLFYVQLSSRMLRIHSPRGAIFRDVAVLHPLHYLDDTSLVVGELEYRAFSLCYAL